MRQSSTFRISHFIFVSCCSVVCHVADAQVPSQVSSAPQGPAQASSGTSDASALSEIVVTGTLIRGTPPSGTNVLQVTQEDIDVSGAVTTQDLLATVPQITSAFNQQPTAGSGGSGATVIRPNIRNLAANGGNTTLLLLDGHNMVGAGVLQTTPDMGVIPPAALERVEVVPDGGSSTYGSDAVGGIVNLITRKNIEGVEVSAHGGLADQYRSGDIDILAGHSWGSGSALLAFDYRDNTDLYGADRDYHRADLAPFGGTDFRTTACDPGTVTAATTNYGLPGFTAGQTNLCDTGRTSDIYPEEHQDSIFGRILQTLADGIDLDVSGYYARRITNIASPAASTTSAIVTAANPYFHSIAGEEFQSVALSYASAEGQSINDRTGLIDYGVTPQVTFKLGHDWELVTLANLGESLNEAYTPSLNPTAQAAALAGTTLSTALDPYDVSATNPAVLSSILNYGETVKTTEKMAEFRAIADGSVVHLPGGDVRLATGTQFHYESFNGFFGLGDSPITQVGNRRSESIFSELFVPVIGPDNALPFVRQFNIDLSGRYDHYSDFGGTTNPKIGITYKPIDDLTIRGNFGTSFNAPSLADETGPTAIQNIGISPFQKTFSPTDLLRPTWLLAGAGENLQPQTAHTYSIGGDFRPSFADGLTLSMTYWHVTLDNIIQVIPFYQAAIFSNPGLSKYYILNPTLAQATTFINQFVPASNLLGGEAAIGQNYGFGAPYAIFDAQRVNLGNLNTNGLDFNGVYSRDTSLGTLSASVGGTLTLKRVSNVAGGALFDELAYNAISPLQLAASVGDRIDHLTLRATVLYSAGYPVAGIADQTRVDAFHPVNLYAAYDIQAAGRFYDNTTISLNVDNVGDENPPFYNQVSGTTYGTANGQTFGRYFVLGIRKKF